MITKNINIEAATLGDLLNRDELRHCDTCHAYTGPDHSHIPDAPGIPSAERLTAWIESFLSFKEGPLPSLSSIAGELAQSIHKSLQTYQQVKSQLSRLEQEAKDY